MGFYVFRKTQLAFVSVVIQNVIRSPSFHRSGISSTFEINLNENTEEEEVFTKLKQAAGSSMLTNHWRAKSAVCELQWMTNVPVDHPPAVFVLLLKFLLDEFLVLCWFGLFLNGLFEVRFCSTAGLYRPPVAKAGYCTPSLSLKEEASLQLEDWTASKPHILGGINSGAKPPCARNTF